MREGGQPGQGTAPTLLLLLLQLLRPRPAAADFVLLDPDSFRPLFHDVKINATAPTDQGPLNAPAFEWAKANVPFFEASDKDIETAYAFRWRAYFTHIIPTNYSTNPWVISECFSPSIAGRCSWAAPSGAINAAAGHHIREGRWIRDPIFMDSEIRFWYNFGTPSLGSNGAYSSWIQHASWQRALVSGDTSLFAQQNDKNESLLQAMADQYDRRERQLRVDGENKAFGSDAYEHCYSMLDGWDAMEGSISGGGCRPSVNAMFYGNAMGIAALATELGQTGLAANFTHRAETIREMYLRLLWNPEISFFAVWKDGSPAKRGPHNATNGIPFGFPKWVCGSGTPNGGPSTDPPPRPPDFLLPPVPARPLHCPQTIENFSWACNKTVGVRELLGLGPPWYFQVPRLNDSAKYQVSWAQLFDDQGFQAKWGPSSPNKPGSLHRRGASTFKEQPVGHFKRKEGLAIAPKKRPRSRRPHHRGATRSLLQLDCR